MHNLFQNALLEELKDASNILIAGAGGGFDVYSGVPLFVALKNAGKSVHLANLTFTIMIGTDAEQFHDIGWKVTADTEDGTAYFPEKYLAEWLKDNLDVDQPIWTFETTGVKPLREVYQYVIENLGIDAIVLVDGGTDSILFGDEEELGSPIEDITSMKAVAGFGIELNVSHNQFLENVSKLMKQGAFLGGLHVLPHMKEAKAFQELVTYANECNYTKPSIITSAVSSAIDGEYGDFHSNWRTKGGEMWINPLMNMYWLFKLQGVLNNVVYADLIERSQSMSQCMGIVKEYRKTIALRKASKLTL